MRLEGKVALVTGAGQGIGRSIALTLAKEGADIVVNDVNLETAEDVAKEVQALGRQAIAIKADVTSGEEIGQMVERALNKFRAIDILVNNAAPTDRGLKGLSLSQDTPEALWDKYTAIIQKGCVLCCQAVGKHMVKRESGKIVNISSNLGLVAIPGYAPYCTNKAAVLHLTRVLAVEWGRYNINVNSVSPGNTNTGIMTRHGTTPTPEVAATLPESKSVRFDAPVAEWLGRYPIQRYNEPEDIANAVLFLASAEARNITGQNLTVDGGISILNPMYIWPEQ